MLTSAESQLRFPLFEDRVDKRDQWRFGTIFQNDHNERAGRDRPQPVNLRLSFDGLYAVARHTMKPDALDGSLYAFINRRGTQIGVLYWGRTGFCAWSKRLETGRLISDWGAVKTREVDWTGLKFLLEGIEPKRLRKRYKLPRESAETSGQDS